MKLLLTFSYIFLELYFTISAGKVVGALGVLFFFLFSALCGFYLLKKVMVFPHNFEQLLKSGLSQEQIVLDRFLLVLSAVFLILPGFLSSFFACCLLISPLRHGLQALFKKHNIFLKKDTQGQYFFKNGQIFYQKYAGTVFKNAEKVETQQGRVYKEGVEEEQQKSEEDIYDCEFTVLDEDKKDTK